MLSLSPRYDQFRFVFPKDFIPEEIAEKYAELLNRDANVLRAPIDYLNESIQGITFPGVDSILGQQTQHSSNPVVRRNSPGLGRINVEPALDVNYKNPQNPLSLIKREFTVTFRYNQGLYNYFMLYEILFHLMCKHIDEPCADVLYIDILNEEGVPVSRLSMAQVYMDAIDGLEFSYNKVERESGTFQVTFKFNNLDFDFLEN